MRIKELLRLGDEPWVYIDEMQAHGAVMAGCERFMDRLLAFYRAWSDAAVTVDLPPKQVFRQAGVRGDFRDAMRLGDLARWAAAGLLDPARVTELKDLATAPPQAGPWLFISTGIAVQDALVNRFVYEAWTETRADSA